MTLKVAFIGLGVMGYPMAGFLSRAGYPVAVYNRTRARSLSWQKENGGIIADTPLEAAKGADFVFSCVGNDDDLRAVTLGQNGAFAGMEAGTVFIDHTTASAEVARELNAQAVARGFGFLDAPVSGGQSGAQSGELSIMVGGDPVVFERTTPLMGSYARTVKLMGGCGSGQLTKMVNQICVAGLLQGLAEGLHFAQQAELDTQSVIEVIAKGAAQSWQMDNRSESMLADQFDFGFAVNWMRKDLAIVMDEARNNGAQLPVTALVDQFYAEIQQMGGGRWDTSSLIKRLEAR